MTDLRDQLTAAVGGTYAIGDELGGGGMSRVFAADDLALGRRVVIKVLHPELAAGVNADRFHREVQLAARLQHPHIVPVLTAGDVDGLPFYVMPFVKGESLQAKLGRGPLPIADVMNIMGDVAKALSFAHGEGVVHRDIKPDNILLSGGAATVADFGIAKAISSSRREENEGLTTVGTSLGTAGYMAPEQVAGDPSLDQRADIYALGCVAYEMLTGSAPFAGKSAQQTMAAHVLEQPVAVRDKRPDTPPALAALVMRCMAKDPAERPQSGEEVLAALDDISVGHTGSFPAGKRGGGGKRAIAATLAVVAAAALAIFAYRVLRPAAPANRSATIAVAPFEVLEPSLALWKEGLVDVLSRNLDGAAGMHTVSPSAAIKRWNGRVGRETALTFARKTDAQLVVYGSLQAAGAGLVNATVWLLDARKAGDPIQMEVRDSSSRMDRLGDSLTVKLLSALGAPGGGTVRSLGSGSPAAIKAFLQGAQYFRHTRWDSAAVAFRQAVTIDSTFAIAHAYLNQTLGWTSSSQKDRIAEAAAAQRHLRAGLSPLDSLVIASIGHYWDTVGTVAAQRAGYDAAKMAADRYPNDPLAWYLYADFRLHSDPHLADQEALSLFNRSIEADSDFAPSYVHAVELAYRYGADVGGRYVRAYLARRPQDREEEALRLAMDLSAPGASTDASLQRVLDTANAGVITATSNALMRLTDSAETGLNLLRRVVKRSNAPVDPTVQMFYQMQTGMRGHVDDAWREALAAKSYWAGELPALGLIPLDSAKKVMLPWLKSRSDASFAALPTFAAARDSVFLKQVYDSAVKYQGTVPATTSARQKASVQYFVNATHAYYQLSRGDSVNAAKEFDTLSDTLFDLPIDQFTRARLIARTDPKRAYEMLRQKKVLGDIISVSRELEIGRLAEKLGDTQRAVDSYAFVAGAWQNSENDQLKNAVRESRDALKRLDADGKLRASLSPAR